ncbi:FG-GAP repeat protein [Photobacterium sp. J15]|uniref:FG-GAP repeat protein n=1 Tax=Photobacterium sp. J15 TaxID=265901 RepID=UPI000A043726|nr:FG-GAP repeat protein [Photobacterium sp. J15]
MKYKTRLFFLLSALLLLGCNAEEKTENTVIVEASDGHTDNKKNIDENNDKPVETQVSGENTETIEVINQTNKPAINPEKSGTTEDNGLTIKDTSTGGIEKAQIVENKNIIKPEAFNLHTIEASAHNVKSFTFEWSTSKNATSYQVCLENTSYLNNCQPLGNTVDVTETNIHLDTLLNSQLTFFVMAENDDAQVTSNRLTLSRSSLIAATGYLKASNTDAEDHFGYAVSLSADGNTLAVSAPHEDSNSQGINGYQDNGNAYSALTLENTGAVYVFTRSNGVWTQDAYIKPSYFGDAQLFGYALSLSADGQTLAVSAFNEDSDAKGIDGEQENFNARESGAVYVFTKGTTESRHRYTKSPSLWRQQAYIKASNTDRGDHFGTSLSLSGDGKTLAVGARNEDSSDGGINGDQDNNRALGSGAVYVFTYNGMNWAQQAYIKANKPHGNDAFGISTSLSFDGNTLAVGANGDDSSADGINNTSRFYTDQRSGAVYVFIRTDDQWNQQAYIKSSFSNYGDEFGTSVSLNADGNTLAVGAPSQDSATKGINPVEWPFDADDSGAVYVFTRTLGEWSQQAFIKASNTNSFDEFGSSISLSQDGNTLAVGAFKEDSIAKGIDGYQHNNSAAYSGAVYLFTRVEGAWIQQSYIKAPNSTREDRFGYSLSLSANGHDLAVGARGEDSASTGFNGDQTNNRAANSGAVYLF